MSLLALKEPYGIITYGLKGVVLFGQPSEERQMAQIGEVSKQKDGSFTGRLKTLSINAAIVIQPVKKKEKPEHPDYRISCKGIDVGAAWKKKTKTGKNAGKEYISCSVSAPEFGTLYFNLGRMAGQDDPDVFALIWNEKREELVE